MPSLSLAFAASVNVAGAVALAPLVGLVRSTVGGVLMGPADVYASSSVMRDHVASAPVTVTRILLVVTGLNVTLRQTSVLPLTVAPGMLAHAVPVQYSSVNAVMPYCVNVSVAVGATGAR